MEVVNRLPRPKDPGAIERLVDAQRILCARAVSEEDCLQAKALLEELSTPEEDGGFGYTPALLTLASLYESGFEPAIEKDGAQAARYYLRLLEQEICDGSLTSDLLEEAATQLCAVVKDRRASLTEDEVKRLEALADASGAKPECLGAVGWIRFASVEARKLWLEANEDPRVREQRLAREAAKAEAKARDLKNQQEAARTALATAEELRLQGNDACRQGQLPGNTHAKQHLQRAVDFYAEATAALSKCISSGLSLVPEEAAEIRRQRALLHSNAAQVQVTAECWAEAARLAELSLEDDPANLKSQYRLARAQVGLKDWPKAARTVDNGLKGLKGKTSSEAEAHVLELWKLAEEITKELPEWQWSASRPSQQKPANDFEKRLIGKWEYPGSTFEIRLEPWGALVFHEDTVKIELMRKSKLRWRGEVELISGMVVNVSYEPGSDVLMLEFVPPPDLPEKDHWSGPKKFTATRKVMPAKEKDEKQEQQEQQTPAAAPVVPDQPVQAPVAEEPPRSDPNGPESIESILADVPRELWLVGSDGLGGRYELLTDEVQGGRPVYRHCSEGAASSLFLWFRGGNWGVTNSLKASSMAAPFLARCADLSGRTRHPLELRRPRWQVRRGRGQEELDTTLQLSASAPGDAAKGNHAQTTTSGSPPSQAVPDGATAPPAAVSIAGRIGSQSEVNGRYELSSTSWRGKPVYIQCDEAEDKAQRLKIFSDGNYWVVAREMCSLPRSVARCHCQADSAYPGCPSGAPQLWEFLEDASRIGHMVSVDTRTYAPDRSVALSVAEALKGSSEREALETARSELLDEALSTKQELFDPPSRRPEKAGQTERQIVSPADYPDWVAEASVDVHGEEVRVNITCRHGLAVNQSSLDLSVATTSLHVRLVGQDAALEMQLPTAVDPDSSPIARWSEKTRTLRVRLPVL
eukprot:gb/GFBE01019321.1/.p1 GENE.gb/GFBE01019321.1/~~gb/GFBE01019321.1/.p1  ORF type:complete len:925 (+),score=196.95 gb/GFBE01019321.1/:1-2775(+)